MKEEKESHEEYLKEIRNYYDQTNDLIVRYIGKTYQVGIFNADGTDPYRTHNLYCASQAGIQHGHRILDAGCGNCGPSIDIASSYENVRIDAITVSKVQAKSAHRFVEEKNLSAQIRVSMADFHFLPFYESCFDVLLFLESAGYSYDPSKLFREAFRVLRHGGVLYIKDVFLNEGPLNQQQKAAVGEFDRAYRQKTKTVSATTASIASAGFSEISTRDITGLISVREFVKKQRQNFLALNAFGKLHTFQHRVRPIYFAEIKARKPS